MRWTGDRGQSSVELVAMMPLVVVVALAAGQMLAAGAAREAAAGAAQAAAMARLQGGDPRSAARNAVPGWARGHLKVVVRGRVADVTLTPRMVLPGLSELLTVRERATVSQ